MLTCTWSCGGHSGILWNTLAKASLQVAVLHLPQLPLSVVQASQGRWLESQSLLKYGNGAPASVGSVISEALELLVCLCAYVL